MWRSSTSSVPVSNPNSENKRRCLTTTTPAPTSWSPSASPPRTPSRTSSRPTARRPAPPTPIAAAPPPPSPPFTKPSNGPRPTSNSAKTAAAGSPPRWPATPPSKKRSTQLEQLGAEVTAYAPEWLEQSYGDFAQLTEHVTKIRLADSPAPTPFIDALVENYASLRELHTLELPGCRLTDDDVLHLSVFQQLRKLDLSRTPITKQALAVVDAIESLRELNLDDTSVGWWAKRGVATQLSRRAAADAI